MAPSHWRNIFVDKHRLPPKMRMMEANLLPSIFRIHANKINMTINMINLKVRFICLIHLSLFFLIIIKQLAVTAFSQFQKQLVSYQQGIALGLFKQQKNIVMAEHQETHDNQSFFSTVECQELRKQIALPSNQLIELTYNEEKFNNKLEKFNRTACKHIEDDQYEQAAVYLDEAEKILQYAAGCGKTIERTLITTILNNQACLLQKTSQFEQSANYLQAIIYNINQFLEGCPPLELLPSLVECHSAEFAEMATYFQRKLALSLYHLRFCALTSHSKNNQVALKSARKALSLLKELCCQESGFEIFQDKMKLSSMKCQQNKYASTNQSDTLRTKKILKDLANIKDIGKQEVNQFQFYLQKSLQSIKHYQKKIVQQSPLKNSTNHFESYSIGNLMQASPLPIITKPSHSEHITGQLALQGKLFKVIYISMSYFTIATELRLISASKYSLDEDQRKSSDEFRESKIYHLLSLIIISRYLPCKSVFFDHSVYSFRNHYGIDLLQKASNYQEKHQINKSFSIINHIISNKASVNNSISQIQEIHTNEDHNKSVEVHHEIQPNNNDLAMNMLKVQEKNASPKLKIHHMKEIHNKNTQIKKGKPQNSKSKSIKNLVISFSRAIDSERNLPHIQIKNKQNKSKSKMLQSKGKETMRSRKKVLLTQQDEEIRKGIYYGFPDKSRSKSKRQTLQRKNSKKGMITTKSGLVFQSKRIKNETKVQEEYGIKSAGGFVHKTHKQIKPIKTKNIRNSSGLDEQNIYLVRNNKPNAQTIRMKKVKSPIRTIKYEHPVKRKSMSKEKYIF